MTPSSRADLALAMALDTVAAALDARYVATVLVVAADDALPFVSLGATVVPDEPQAGLNAALRHAAAAARARAPQHSIAALVADLPALAAADLDAVLATTASTSVAVPDSAGTGTTLLATPAPLAFSPAFGAGSLAAHVAAGAVVTTAALPTLRRDVDTRTDLVAALEIGLGVHTLQALRLASDLVQATVRRFDAATRSGEVLLDDGALLVYGSDAFDRSGLRLLRLGQRVRILVEGDRVVFLTLATFPDPV